MRGQVFPFGDLRGGLNTRDSAYEVAANQARDLLNVSGSVNGAVRKRDGTTLFSTVPNILGGALAADATATRQIIAADPTAGLFRSISTAGAPTALTNGASVAVGSAAWTFIQAPTASSQGPVFGMNGVNPPVRWDGGSTVNTWTGATFGNVPNGKYAAFHGNRLFVAGMSAYTPSGGSALTDPGSALVFSNVANPTDWPAANVVLFDPFDGDAITGLGTVGPYLLVFKRKKVFVVYDLDTGANRRIADNTGCVSHRSVVETPAGTFFLSERGVYSTNGQSLTLHSDIITPTIQGIAPANLGLAAAAFFNNHYYLSVSTSGSANNVVLDYDMVLQSWWVHSIAVSQFLTWRPVSTLGLYGVDSATARIGRLFVPSTPSDYGLAFSAYWTGAWLAPGGNVTRHRLRQVRADISGHVQLCLSTNFAGAPTPVKDFNLIVSTTTFGGADTFGGGGTFGDPSSVGQVIAPTPSPSVGRAFSLLWTSNHTDPWQLEAFEMIVGQRNN